MKGLFGVANTTIFRVSTIFKEQLMDVRVQILGFEDNVRPRAGAVLVPTTKLFLKHRKSLERTNASVFVFDTPILLDYLSPIKLLDSKKAGSLRYKMYDLDPADVATAIASKNTSTITCGNNDVISTLLGATLPSVMKPIQTFLYSIQDTEHRNYCSAEILHYLASSKTKLSDLGTSLILASKQKKTSPALERLMTFLEEDTTKQTKKVVTHILRTQAAGDTSDVDTLCCEARISAYDVNYILHALGKHKRYYVRIPRKYGQASVFREYGPRHAR